MHAVVAFLHGMQYILIVIIVIRTLYLYIRIQVAMYRSYICMACSLPSSYGNMCKCGYFSVLVRMHKLPLYLRIYVSGEQGGKSLDVILIINLASYIYALST